MRKPEGGAGGQGSELASAISSCRAALAGVGLMSGMVNLLMLTGALFMLQVYDRVLPSRSVPTLVGLTVLAGGLYLFQGILDGLRARVLVRVGGFVEESIGQRSYDLIIRLPLKPGIRDGASVLRDLDNLRNYLTGLGPTAFFDLPWMPLYLAICLAFHPLIGMVATIGAIVLFSLTLATEIMTRVPAAAACRAAAQRSQIAEAARRNSEALRAMGFSGRIGRRWVAANADLLRAQRRSSDVAGGLGALSRVVRMLLQSGMLGLGAWLYIRGQASAGVIIASSIIMSRALAPVELAITHWKSFVAARQSWHRLERLLAAVPAAGVPMALPAPKQSLAVENLTVIPPGAQRPVANEISFILAAGDGLGIIGPSASGKSSLARAIVGVWPAARGSIRLDGGTLEQWAADALGPHVGYLPQDVELFAGTVAENIGRFEEEPDAKAVIAAASAADIHQMILRLPDGYSTEIGESGAVLSAGQRQRVALARALYRDPFLVVLDEPNSNLDADGETALTDAILAIRARGGIAVVVAHRPSALAGVDKVLMMRDGRVQAFGPKAEVLGRVLRHGAAEAGVVRPFPTQGVT